LRGDLFMADSKAGLQPPSGPSTKFKRKIEVFGGPEAFKEVVNAIAGIGREEPSSLTAGSGVPVRKINVENCEIECFANLGGYNREGIPCYADVVIHALEDYKGSEAYEQTVISSTDHPPVSYIIDLRSDQKADAPKITQSFGKLKIDEKSFDRLNYDEQKNQISKQGTFSPSMTFKRAELTTKLVPAIKEHLAPQHAAELTTKLVPAIKEHLAPQHAKEKIETFEKIYKALRDGQSSWIKTNYLSKITNEDRKDPYALYHKIKKYAEQNPNSRAAKAWGLMQIHFDPNTASLTNHPLSRKQLEDEIYKWSFAQSGWFKKSKATGMTLFSSTLVNQYLEDGILLKANVPENSRLGKIRKALEP